MTAVVATEADLTAADGVLELPLILGAARGPLRWVPGGPRGWALTGVEVEVEDGAVAELRLTCRTPTVPRTVRLAQRLALLDGDGLARRAMTPLAAEAARAIGASTAALAALLPLQPWWQPGADDWRTGSVAAVPGAAPVRAVATSFDGVAVVLAGLGVAAEELSALARTLEVIDADQAIVLQAALRRHLAQRWWDAPRRPWRPPEREQT